MDIPSVSLMSSASGAGSSQAQGSGTQKNPLALRRESSTNTQLSALGQVKLSLDDLKSKAQALQGFQKPPTLADFKVAVQGFVQSFNALHKSVSDAAAKAPALNQTLDDVRSALAGSNDSSLSALQQVGISGQKGGTFSINQNQLDKSFQNDRVGTLSTLSDVASRVEKTADKQISSNGFIGKKMNDLSERSNEIESQRRNTQVRLDVQKNSQQRLVSQLSADGYVARNAVLSYFSVSSM